MKIILLLILLPLAIAAQNNNAAYDEYMNGQASLFKFNGNVLVAKEGRIIYKQSFGYADFKTHTKLNENSVFDCGSIAKEFTAMGILLLKDKGKISYSDSLRKFFPQLQYSVTIRQLLTHTSGIPDGYDLVEKYADHSRIATNEDLIRLLATYKPPLLFKPGENLAYSGTGFNLLACIIEKVTGQTYKTYMNENVFMSLGMKHTRVSNEMRTATTIPGYAYGFVYNDSLKQFVWAGSQGSDWVTYFTGITGEGMIVTTTGDMLKWDRALKAHSLLKASTQQEMLSPQAEKVFPKIAFGYGMRVGQNSVGKYIFHNGYYPGFLSMHLRYVDEDLTVIVLSNNESHAEFIADGLAAISLHKKILLPYVHQKIEQGIVPVKYQGKFMMELVRPPYMALWPVEIVNRNNELYLHSPFTADIKLVPESDRKFFYADGTDQQIEFETSADGSLLKAWQIGWGVRKELKRVE
jgi:CubicO group peptidase (beta-lactamase class C family)